MHKVGRGKPAKMIGGENLAIASVVLPADDRCINFAAIERIQQVAGVIEPYFDGERRIVGMQTRQ